MTGARKPRVKKPPLRERLLDGCIRTYLYVLDRLAEPSTLRGLVLAATGLGVAMAPERVNAIVAIGAIVVGILGVITPDTWRKRVEKKQDAPKG